MTILVTGGTGFLGKNLVRRLVDSGRTVRVLARSEKRLAGLPLDRIEVAYGDLGDPESIAEASQGVDEVIHAAALVTRWVRDRRDFDRINVDGTRAVLDAAHRAGATKIVYVSSFFALGSSDGGTNGVGDETLRRPVETYTDYERTKHLATLEAEDLCQRGAPVVMVYPCVIYGPGELTEANIVAGMLRDHLRGKLPGIPGNGTLQWTYAYVHDVVDGIVLALEKGRVGERYILGGETASANRFFEIFHEVSGKKPPRRKLPYGLLKVVAVCEEGMARMFGKNPKLTRQEVATYRHNWAFECEKAKRELGYAPKTLREGLEKTYEWLVEREPKLRVRSGG